MSDLEAILWRLGQHDAALRPTVVVVVTFEGRPDAAALRSRLHALIGRLPRLGDRVSVGPLVAAPPVWEPDPEFDLDNHLILEHAASDLENVLRRAAPIALGAYPPGRPPWRMHLLQDESGSSLIVKLHHSYTDGLGAVQLAGELFDVDEVPAEPEPVAAVADPSPGQPALGRLLDDLEFETDYGLRAAGRLARWGASSVRDCLIDPLPRAQSVLDLARSARDAIGNASREANSALAGRSAATRFATLTLPLDDLRRTASEVGGTVNDVYVACLLAGLRRYLGKRGESPPSLRVGIPVSTRSGAVGEGGNDMRNQFAPIIVRAPLQLLDATERIRVVHELVLAARRQPLLDLMEDAMGVFRRVPASGLIISRIRGAVDFMASNVPGSPVDLYLAGAKVRRIIPFGPRNGNGLNATLISHAGNVTIGFNLDALAVYDVDLFLDCARSGFDETLA